MGNGIIYFQTGRCVRGTLLIITLGEMGVSYDFARQSKVYGHSVYKLIAICKPLETKDHIYHVHNNICGASHIVGAQ